MNRLSMIALASACLFACQPQQSSVAFKETAETQLILDGTRTGGVTGFNFLPSIVAKVPAGMGPLPATQPSVQLRIDRVTLSPAGCTTGCTATVVKAGVASFSTGSTIRDARIVFHRTQAERNGDDDDEDRGHDRDLDNVPGGYFLARWKARGTEDGFYRAHVAVPSNGGLLELGLADIEVVDNGRQLRRVDARNFVPLQEGAPLAIRFRIAASALACANVTCAAADQCHVAGVCDPVQGKCTNPTANEGMVCNDQNGCTLGEACHAGVCGGGTGCDAHASCGGAGPTASCSCGPGYTGNGQSCAVALRFLSSPPAAAVAGQTLRYQAVVSVAGGTTFSLAGPAGSTVDDSGLVSWTPGAADAGARQLTLTASLAGTSVAQPFTVRVATTSVASHGTFDPNDPAGATVSVQAPLSPIKGAALVVPQGALSQGTALTVSSVSGLAAPPSLPMGTNPAMLQPVEFGPAGATFSQPVRLVLPFAPGLLTGGGASVLTLDTASGRWVPVEVERVDAVNGVVVARTTHFSTYVVVPATTVYNLQIDLGGNHTSCFGTPLVRAPLAQQFKNIPAGAVNNWPVLDAKGNPITPAGSSLFDVLTNLPIGKALQLATRLDTELTGTTTGRQTYLIASATKTAAGLNVVVTDNRQPGQFLAIPNHAFLATDPELEAWMNGSRVSNLIDSVYADLAAGLGTGVTVTAEAAFAVVDADLANTLLPRPAVVYGAPQRLAKTTAQLHPLDNYDTDCDDAPDLYDPNPNSTPPPGLTGTPSPFIHTNIGSPVTLALSSPSAGATFSFVASDPSLQLVFSGATATITPAARGVYSVTGSATVSGLTALWSWQVLVDSPVVVDPPPVATVSADRASALVGQAVVLTASGAAARVTPDQLTYRWTSSPDAHALSASTGPSVSLIANAPGDYTVSVVASDGVLSSSAATVTLSIAPAGSARPPAPPLVTPLAANIQHLSGSPVQVAIAASGTAFNGSAATLQFAAAPGSPTTFVLAANTFGTTFSTTADGSYALYVTAVDGSGNVSPPTRMTLLVTGVLPPNPVDADGDGYPAGVGPGFDCDDNDATTHPGQPPECDGLKDRNCDGVITDANTCDADRDGFSVAQGDCNDHDAAIHPGAPELCDGVDNNCNGVIDEGYSGLGSACSAGVGVCQAAGTLVCGRDLRSVVCNAAPGAPHAEQCNGLDNNCDGIIGNVPGGGTDVNNCGGCGVKCVAPANMAAACVSGGCLYTCVAGFGDANHTIADGCECTITNGGVEICDGLDNNCDGRIDENLTQTFYSGLAATRGVGTCHAGVQSCAGGVYVTVQPEQAPLPELCNGLDDNCNGVIDDGFNLATDPGNCGACGVACTSTQHCISSGCLANRPPSLAPLGALALYEGSTRTLSVTGNDPDADVLTFTLPGAPAWATIAAVGSESATLTLAPDASSGALPNPITIEVDANDGHGGIAQAFLALTVTHPPALAVFDVLVGADPGGSPDFSFNAGAWRLIMVDAAAAQGTASPPLTVTCDGPGPVVQPPLANGALAPWTGGNASYAPNGTQATIGWTPSSLDEGVVRRCHASTTDGTTTATRDFTLSAHKGLVAATQLLAGGFPAQTSPVVLDTVDAALKAHRYVLVAEMSGLSTYEVTGDVISPRLAFLELHSEAFAVAVLGHYAFVADGRYGLDVIDVSDPLHPALYTEVTDPTALSLLTDIAVDPAHQRIAVSAQQPPYTYVFDLASFLATGDRTALGWTDVVVPSGPDGPFGDTLGRAAFVQLGSPAKDVLLIPEESAMSLYAVDLGASGGPAVIGQYKETHNDNNFGARSVEPFTSPAQPGKQLAVLNTGQGIWAEILDVTNPARMSLLGAVNTNANSTGAVISGHTWFAAEQFFINVVTVDLTDPTHPTTVINYNSGGYQGGLALSADGARLYDPIGERGMAIWDTALLAADLNGGSAPIAQGQRQELRISTAVSGSVGFTVQRDQLWKLDTSVFPPQPLGMSLLGPHQGYQGTRALDLNGTLGISQDLIYSNTLNRWIGAWFRTWDLSGAAPVQLGKVQVTNTANLQINNNRLRFIQGTQCAVGTLNQAGAVLIDVSTPAAPIAGAVLQPMQNGAVLANANVEDAYSDGRFVFVFATNLPGGFTGLFVWDLGASPNCAAPVFLGQANTIAFHRNFKVDMVSDVAKGVLYLLSPGGGGIHLMNYSALQAAALANTPLDVTTQMHFVQRARTGLLINAYGHLLLGATTLVASSDQGPLIYSRAPDGTLTRTETLTSATPGWHSYVNLMGGYLWWDQSDPLNPNAFIEQGPLQTRKWALCGALDNTTCPPAHP